MPPEVSIILCLYNGAPYLPATIDSALRQSFAGFELIVVDDGSTDGSAEILQRYPDPRLRLIRQPNQGTAGALITGLQAATGAYISFLDQDDLWEKDSLATQVEFLSSHPAIDLSFTWFRMIDSDGGDMGLRSARFHGATGFQSLLSDFVIGANSNIVARRSAIERAGGVDPQLRIFFNVDLCLRIALLSPAENIAAIPRDLMSYRRHPGQLSRNSAAVEEEWGRTLAKMRSLAPTQVAAVEGVAVSNFSRYLARVSYEDRRFGRALAKLAAAFRHAPAVFLTDARNWLTAAACLSGLLLPRPAHRALERLGGLRRK